MGSLGAPSWSYAGEETAEERLAKEVSTLLTQVASDDFAIREAARTRLQTLARPARTLLEARRGDPDPEVRRTIEGLLGPQPAPETPAGALGSLGLVTFAAKGTLQEVIDQFGAQVGGNVLLPATGRDAAVEIQAESVPYFQVLGGILGAAGLDAVDGFDDAGVATASPIDAATRAACVAYAGPFRADVVSVQTTRTIRPGPRLRFAIGITLLWSPEVEVVSYTMPSVVRAVDATGVALRGIDADGSVYGHGGARRANLTLTLEPPTAEVPERVETLEMRTRLRLRSGQQSAVFEGLEGLALPASRVVPLPSEGGREAKVVLEAFGPDPERAEVRRAIVAVVPPRGATPDGLSVRLVTDDGGVHAMVERSSRVVSSDGVVKVTVRAYGLPVSAKAKALRVAWYSREGEMWVPLSMKGLPLR